MDDGPLTPEHEADAALETFRNLRFEVSEGQDLLEMVYRVLLRASFKQPASFRV